LEEGEQSGIGVGGAANRLVIEDELAERGVEPGRRRRGIRLGEAGRRGIGVGIEERPARSAGAAGPEAGAGDFVAIGFAGDLVREVRNATGWRRAGQPGERADGRALSANEARKTI
jgi:hypothetical protein